MWIVTVTKEKKETKEKGKKKQAGYLVFPLGRKKPQSPTIGKKKKYKQAQPPKTPLQMNATRRLGPSIAWRPHLSRRGLNHELLAFVQQRGDPPQVLDHPLPVAHEQQLLRIGRQTKVRRRLALGQPCHPIREVSDVCSARQNKVFHPRDQRMIVFKSRGRKERVDEVTELFKVFRVVDLAAVRLRNKRA